MEEVFTEVENRYDDYLDDLFELLSQRSVSTTGEGIEVAAQQVRDLLDTYGFDASLVPTSNHPIVLGERMVSADAPTVLFYGHYDVQPAGDLEEWDSPPFEPTVRDGSIYARGSGDNKGQFVTHIFAADAFEAANDSVPINIRLLIEGGEECGSPGLIEYVDESPETFDVDLVYVSDGSMHRSGDPTLRYGNRGLLAVELTATGPSRDLHSGIFGGPVPNPAVRLVSVLDSMVDEDGRLAVDGAYDGIAVSQAERDAVEDIPIDAEAIRSDVGVDSFTVPDEEYYQRLLLELSFTINGLSGGYAGEGINTIIPKTASAKIDMRLIPDQDPDALFEAICSHVAARDDDIEVEKLGTFPPMRTSMDTPFADPILQAQRRAWDTEPVEVPLHPGGLPAAHFRKHTNVPILIIPYANPDQANHSPNEHLDAECFVNGIKTTAAFFEFM